ncbi:hypothetical protein BKA65DRAFT_478727 [Rhexocercosporidium sp. MPI-PUGE-AT-0058]|nr:hypothetical protein BKA65DRAFT_478727 [Rhexocercosporidium sp. MPI-PUGE-AT-0058]
MDKKDGKKLIPVYATNGRALGIVKSYVVAGKKSKKQSGRKSKSTEESSAATPDTNPDAPIFEDPRKSKPVQPKTSFSPSTRVSENGYSLAKDIEQPESEKKSVAKIRALRPSKGNFKDDEEPIPRYAQDSEVIVQDNSEPEADVQEQPKTTSKRRSKPKPPSKIADITFPGVSLGKYPEFMALRCDDSCPEHSQSDGDELGGAHIWCMTHSRFHCLGAANETCNDVVLCGVSVVVYNRMWVELHGDRASRGGDSDNRGGRSGPSDENDDRDGQTKSWGKTKKTATKKASESFLVAAQSSADIVEGSSRPQNDAGVTSILKKEKAEGEHWQEEGRAPQRKKSVQFRDGTV